MKNKLLSSFFFLLASICSFMALFLSIKDGETSGTRFYLQGINGTIDFLILACVMFLKKSSKE